MFDLRVWRGMLALMAALAATAMLAACGSGSDASGDSDDDDGGHSGVAGEVNTTLERMQADYIAGRGAEFCSRLTAEGVAQAEEFGRVFSIAKRCEKIIAKVSDMSSDVKQKPTKLLSVKVDGNTVVARVKDGGRPPENMRFVKEDGEWKLPDPGFPTSLSGDQPDKGDAPTPPSGTPSQPSPSG